MSDATDDADSTITTPTTLSTATVATRRMAVDGRVLAATGRAARWRCADGTSERGRAVLRSRTEATPPQQLHPRGAEVVPRRTSCPASPDEARGRRAPRRRSRAPAQRRLVHRAGPDHRDPPANAPRPRPRPRRSTTARTQLACARLPRSSPCYDPGDERRAQAGETLTVARGFVALNRRRTSLARSPRAAVRGREAGQSLRHRGGALAPTPRRPPAASPLATSWVRSARAGRHDPGRADQHAVAHA